MKRFFTLILFSLVSYVILQSSTSSAPSGNTGAPSEGTCAGCHAGGSGTTNVSFSLSGTTNTYKSDSTYTVTVTVSNSSYVSPTNKFGFSMVALNSSNASVGTLTAGANNNKVTTSRVYINHSNATNISTWNFTWKAPTTAYTGNVTFYVCGNATNGTGGSFGDQSGNSSFVFTNANPTPPDINVKSISTNYLSGSTFNYGNSNIGVAKDTIFSVQNIGANSLLLKIDSVKLTGANPTEFALLSSTSFNVSANNSFDFNVRFKPTSAGAKTATLTFYSNDPDEANYVVNLNGTGVIPPAKLTLTQNNNSINHNGTFNYGTKKVNVNNDTVFVIKNTGGQILNLTGIPSLSGTNAADFTLVSLAPTGVLALNPNDSLIGTLRFKPAGIGARVAALTIPSNDPTNPNFILNLNGTGKAPDIDITQNATNIASNGNFNYNNVSVGAFLDKTFVLKNSGNDSLRVTSMSISGTNSGDFSIQSSTNAVIAPNATFNLVLRFTPGAGSRTGKISITSDDPDENPFEINLSGTGITGTISVKQGANTIVNTGNFNYGITVTGTGNAKTFTISNTGVDSLRFSSGAITGTNASEFTTATNFSTFKIAPSTSANFDITFTPTAVGSRTALITLVCNDLINSPFVINLAGTGELPADINIKQATNSIANGGSFDYGNKLMNSNTDSIFVIENIQGIDLNVSNVSLTGTNASEFQVMTSFPKTIAATTSVNCIVRFKPNSLGSKTANLIFTSNDPDENPYTITLNGNSVSPEINIKQGATNIANAGNHNFGVSLLNVNNDVTFTIENTGTAILSGIQASIGGVNAADFSIQTAPSTSVNTSSNSNIVIRYKPLTAGSKSATLNILSNDLDENPYVIFLTGQGLTVPQPELDLTESGNNVLNSSNYAFGNINTGGTKDVTYTLKNNGNDTLKNIVASIQGTNASQFTIISSPNALILPNESSTVTVRYAPTSTGTFSAKLNIASNDGDENPFVVFFTGSNVFPEIDLNINAFNFLTGSVYSFSNVKVGSTGLVTIKISNKGAATLNIASSTISGIDAADFSIPIKPNANITTNSSTNMQIEFSPKTMGVKSATLTIASNDADEANFDVVLDANATSSIIDLLPEQISIKQSEYNFEINNSTSQNYQFNLYDLQGNLLTNSILEKSININTQDYPKGVYIIELINENTRENFFRKISF